MEHGGTGWSLDRAGLAHPDYLLMSAVFMATGREKKILPGCNSPPQIIHEVCPEAYLAGGDFPPCQLKLFPAEEMLPSCPPPGKGLGTAMGNEKTPQYWLEA